MAVSWDYTKLAYFYDKRADYSNDAINKMLETIDAKPGDAVVDIGAGTGKLTKHLKSFGLRVTAVEPCNEMREIGIKNLAAIPGTDVIWMDTPGEETNLPDASFTNVFFGSSFNVVDADKMLSEVARILKPGGHIVCMWNHRDLNNVIQAGIERIIQSEIPSYNYGERRKDPSETIEKSKLFTEISHVSSRFNTNMSMASIIEAWKSHATLQRQAGAKFDALISKISEFLAQESNSTDFEVPYDTNIWMARATK